MAAGLLSKPPVVSAILLAAGTSRRMGGRDKLLLEYKGKSLLERAIELLNCLECRDKIIVTTKARIEQVDLTCSANSAPTCIKTAAHVGLSSVVRAPDTSLAIHVVINPNPEAGQSSSLRLGLEAATGEWYLFMTADQPLLTSTCLQPMFELAEKNTDKIVFPSVNGKPCTPTLFPARFRDSLMSLTGDIGGRAVRDAYPDACLTFEAENPDGFMDIDCEDDYQALIRFR